MRFQKNSDAGRLLAKFPSSLLLFLFLLGLLTACGSSSAAVPTPPTIHYGEDVCEFCGMIVSEERYAAAFITADGHGHMFDDIGDMVQTHLQMQEDVTAFFVHDHESRDWIRAETAHFVQSDSLTTPMLSGLAAFETADAAAAFAAENQGEIFNFDDLLAQYRRSTSAPAMIHHH